MDPKFYADDYFATNIDEIEYIRSPFYDLAKMEQMSSDKANEMLEEIEMKMTFLESL